MARSEPHTATVQTLLLDNLPDAIAWLIPVFDETQQVIDFIFRYTNQKAKEVVGKGFLADEGLRLLADNTAQVTFAQTLFIQYVEVYTTGESKEYSYFNPITNTYFYVSRRKWQDGVLSITRDRTAERVAEQVAEQVRQRHIEQLQFVTDSSLTAIGLYSIVRQPETGEVIDLRYELINQMAERMTGKPARDLVGRTMREVFPGIEKSGIWPLYKKLAETGQPIHYHNHYTFDGYDLWYQVQGVRKDEQIVLSFLDITELKKSQEEKQRHADLLNSILASSPIAFAQHQAIRNDSGEIVDFRFLLVNQAFEVVTDFPIDEISKKTVLTINPNLKQEGTFDQYVSVVETGRPIEKEQLIGNHWFQVSVVKFEDGYISAAIDITQSREDRQRLEAINQELRRSNESLQQFAYVASHDLQEPLRKIQSFGDLLINQFEPSLGNNGRDLITRMQTASSRMSLLIRDLLAYSRVSTQRDPFNLVSLHVVLEEVLEDLEIFIRDTGAIVRFDPLPQVLGDAMQLRQLFQNLIANSIKFRRSGIVPIIQISCIWRNQAELTPFLAAAGRSFYEISITDNGIGFDSKYADRIFEVFQRLHTKQHYTGTGVGLSICKKVAENHGGTITAEGYLDEGSTFRVYLPDIR